MTDSALALLTAGLLALLAVALLAGRLLPNPYEPEDEDTPPWTPRS